MKQVQITTWGGPEVFELVDAPTPQPAPGQLLIKVASIGLNPVDWKTRSGHGIAGLLPQGQPLVLGWDVAGTVAETGPDTTGFAIGDEVYGLVGFPDLGNAYAEYVLIKASEVTRVPTALPLIDAAATPLVALTAWQGLFDIAGLQAGQSVLIHAGAGGVGHVAIQLARQAGAEVYATASASNQDFLHELGATPIDYTAGDFRDSISEVDLVLDTIGGDVFTRSLDVIRPGGRIIAVPDPSQLDEARQRGIQADWVFVHPDRAQLARISELIDTGALRVVIDRRFGLCEFAVAHAYGEQGHVRGKLVVNP